MLIDKAIAGCAADDVEEIRALGRTLASWRTEILAHHTTGASNGPTEGLIIRIRPTGVVDVDDEMLGLRGGRVLWSVSPASLMWRAA